LAATLGPLDTIIVSKFIKTLSVAEGPPTGSEQAQLHERESDRPPNNLFKMGMELMYGGQGKTTNNFNLMPVNAQENEKTSDTDFRAHPDTNFRVDNVTQKNEETSNTDFRVHPDTNFRVNNVTNINKGLDQPRLDETNAEVMVENK